MPEGAKSGRGTPPLRVCRRLAEALRRGRWGAGAGRSLGDSMLGRGRDLERARVRGEVVGMSIMIAGERAGSGVKIVQAPKVVQIPCSLSQLVLQNIPW